MLSLFVYSSATVFVIVGGQLPTIDDDDDDGDDAEAGSAPGNCDDTNSRPDLSHLINIVTRLEAKHCMLEARQNLSQLINAVTRLEAKHCMLEAKVARLEAKVSTTRPVSYTHLTLPTKRIV